MKLPSLLLLLYIYIYQRASRFPSTSSSILSFFLQRILSLHIYCNSKLTLSIIKLLLDLEMALESISLMDNLVKVALFVLVQALVYVILSSSSNLFSQNRLRSLNSFKLARSASINRILAAISDSPTGSTTTD